MASIRLHHFIGITLYCGIFFLGHAEAKSSKEALIEVAGDLLDEGAVSYVFGGSEKGDPQTCRDCNDCLGEKKPSPKERLVKCPVCQKCSLDCSHFTALVFRLAGLPYPYLDTKLMLDLSASALLKRYHLVDLGDNPSRAEAGDLLVYDGHVVMLERRHRDLGLTGCCQGDIVHATGGKDLKGPGAGIQRERFINISNFRGMLRRILRHQAFVGDEPRAPSIGKFRPVLKREFPEDG